MLFLIHFHTPFLKPEKVQQIAVPLDPRTSNHHKRLTALDNIFTVEMSIYVHRSDEGEALNHG